jgi:hypothetical protein
MEEIIKKLLYCIRMMNLIKQFSSIGNSDYEKRIISRYIFVYFDSFLVLAPILKNNINKGLKSKNKSKFTDSNIIEVEKKISEITIEYNSFYSILRDKVSAHRKDLSIIELCEVWNEIDVTALDYYISEALDIYNLLHSLEVNEIPKYIDFHSISKNISNFPDNINYKFSSDNLALTRTNTIALIPSNDLQKRVSQINSIIDTIQYIDSLYMKVCHNLDLERLIKSMLIMDILNLLENIYPHSPKKPEYKIDSLFEILKKSNGKSFKILTDFETKRNYELEKKITNVRNIICAHIDKDKNTLEECLGLLDTITLEELNQIYSQTFNAFEKSCEEDIILKRFLNIEQQILDNNNIVDIQNTLLIKDFQK